MIPCRYCNCFVNNNEIKFLFKYNNVNNFYVQFLLEDYLRTIRQVKLEVRPLLLPQVVRLSSLLLPGLKSVLWTSEDWKEFIDRANSAINGFDVLVTRVHDIYTNRIIYMLSGMQEVSLITLPGIFHCALHNVVIINSN